MGLNGFASLLPAAYWLHKIVFMDEHLFVRSASTFGLLSLIGFGTSWLEVSQRGSKDKNTDPQLLRLSSSVNYYHPRPQRTRRWDGTHQRFRIVGPPRSCNEGSDCFGNAVNFVWWVSVKLYRGDAVEMLICRYGLAVMGFLVAYMGWMSERTEQNRVCGHSNAAQNMTARHMDNKSFHSSASTLVPGGDFDINKGQYFNVSWNDTSSRSG